MKNDHYYNHTLIRDLARGLMPKPRPKPVSNMLKLKLSAYDFETYPLPCRPTGHRNYHHA